MADIRLGLPGWAEQIAADYSAQAASQFILHGNVEDRFVLPDGSVGGLRQFLLDGLLGRFEVVLTYDLGNGVRVEKGGKAFAVWPGSGDFPGRTPLASVDWLTHFFRFWANLVRLGKETRQVACVIWAADLVAPGSPSTFENNAVASLFRDWAIDDALTQSPIATLLVSGSLHDLHPLVRQNPWATKCKVPLPDADTLAAALGPMAVAHPGVFAELGVGVAADRLRGATLHSVESLVRRAAREDQALAEADIAALRKQLVEDDAGELIEFIPPKRTLDDLHGLEAVKRRFREDWELIRQGADDAVPMGYLVCGPVGTGKTYLVECMAGEAGIPVVKLRNFRDRWIGSTEANLEKIFRLLHALGRCFVFVDEADQALGRRDGGGSDSGLSGRIYAMIAKEMANPDNRGKLLWVLATSRPDLVEIDLKRPGRIDVKLPLFPTATPEEGYGLLRALCGRRGLSLPEELPAKLLSVIPDLLTPGAADALSVRAYRLARTQNLEPLVALEETLRESLPPIDAVQMERQIRLAVAEASERAFVPERFRLIAERGLQPA